MRHQVGIFVEVHARGDGRAGGVGGGRLDHFPALVVGKQAMDGIVGGRSAQEVSQVAIQKVFLSFEIVIVPIDAVGERRHQGIAAAQAAILDVLLERMRAHRKPLSRWP